MSFLKSAWEDTQNSLPSWCNQLLMIELGTNIYPPHTNHSTWNVNSLHVYSSDWTWSRKISVNQMTLHESLVVFSGHVHFGGSMFNKSGSFPNQQTHRLRPCNHFGVRHCSNLYCLTDIVEPSNEIM